ncbi:MAG: hypothetical protein V3S16_14180 [Candidatus Desulfatibia sp.]|uniref:hypothetical protein n=1 Tax=Candidatus Desulfatibia sp. TaxID=3101189 RepID=UPI002F2FF117
MKKLNKFETTYKSSRDWIRSYFKNDKKLESVEARRRVFQAFKQEVQMALTIDVNTNAWIFDQNELKDSYSGKQTLRSMCETFYYEAVGAAGRL